MTRCSGTGIIKHLRAGTVCVRVRACRVRSGGMICSKGLYLILFRFEIPSLRVRVRVYINAGAGREGATPAVGMSLPPSFFSALEYVFRRVSCVET